jgi:hypothetical protein
MTMSVSSKKQPRYYKDDMELLKNEWQKEHDQQEIIDQELTCVMNSIKDQDSSYENYLAVDDFFLPNTRVFLSHGKWLAREQNRVIIRQQFYQLANFDKNQKMNSPKIDEKINAMQQQLKKSWIKTRALASKHGYKAAVEMINSIFTKEINPTCFNLDSLQSKIKKGIMSPSQAERIILSSRFDHGTKMGDLLILAATFNCKILLTPEN